MNRNIVTAADISNIQAGQVPPALQKDPPAWTDSVAPAAEGAREGSGIAARLAVRGGARTGQGGVPIPTEDDYLTRLVKFIPVEVLGAYLFMSGIITSNVHGPHDRAAWLGALLLAFGAITALYDWRVLHISRPIQIEVSVVALGAYVFATGGWFATTTWYHPWYGALVLPLFALLAAIVPVRPLPTGAK